MIYRHVIEIHFSPPATDMAFSGAFRPGNGKPYVQYTLFTISTHLPVLRAVTFFRSTHDDDDTGVEHCESLCTLSYLINGTY